MKKLLFLSAALVLGMSACKKDDPEVPNEEEFISSVVLNLVSSGGNTTTAAFRDLDGPGGNDPEVDTLYLSVNETYTGSVQFLNETESPAEDITLEVLTEGEEHQVFYIVSQANLNFDYTDTDPNQNPIGVETAAQTGAASVGSLQVVLRHEPNKSAAGVANGDITNAGGETDVEVNFYVVIQ